MTATPQEHFAAMARAIESAAGPFGGAVVVVPPGGEKTISILISDSNGDPAFFFATIHSKLKIVIDEIASKPTGPFHR